MLIAHIGMGKVGSSSIQATLAANREVLARQGVVWPDMAQRSSCNFHALAKALRGDRDDQPLRQLCQAMGAHGGSVAISSEFLWHAGADGAARLRRALGKHSAKIVVFLRPYEDLVRSVYMQQTRTRGTQNFDQRFPTMTKGLLRVRSVVSDWADAFGVEALHIRHVGTLPGGDVVAEFLRLIDAEATVPIAANVTPHWTVCELSRALYGYRKAGRLLSERGALRAFLSQLDRDVRDQLAIPDTPYLTAEQRRALRRQYREDALWLHGFAGVPLPPEPDEPCEERPFLPSLEKAPEEFLDLVRRRRKSDLKEQAPLLAKRIGRLLAALPRT